jgi:MoaA/NifB/PqqE/SkfB family radical SAM enzyme
VAFEVEALLPCLVVELSDETAGARPHSSTGEATEAAPSISFLDPVRFGRAIRAARDTNGIRHIWLTGKAPALHPDLPRIFATVAAEDLTAALLLDGEQFEAVWAALAARRDALTQVCFRLDGIDAEAHDRRRGAGSFKRLVSAFTRCRAAHLPFGFLFEVRRETLSQLEQAALFAARLGAASLTFQFGESTLRSETGAEENDALAASAAAEAERPLDADDRAWVAGEVAALARVFRMKVSLTDGCPGSE